MKHSFTTLLLLCSMAVLGQTKIKTSIANSDTLNATIAMYGWSSNGFIHLAERQDTTKVIMLITKESDINKSVQLMQIEGYSVTPKYVFNELPRAYYLNIHKQPMPDDVIVWMSIQR